MKINVLDISFEYNGTSQTINPVIIQDNETMILVDTGYLYITIEKYTIFQLKSIPVLIVCEDKKSYLNAG